MKRSTKFSLKLNPASFDYLVILLQWWPTDCQNITKHFQTIYKNVIKYKHY